MLKTGILNPGINDLISRIRHTNTLVISDLGFPFWPQIETVDIALVSGIPTVLEVLSAIEANFTFGQAWMAQEFLVHNPEGAVTDLNAILKSTPLHFEPHLEFKKRVPFAIGLIRTGDPRPYSNIILESA